MNDVPTSQTAPSEVSEISRGVVKEVAATLGTSPVELTPPLYEVIDPDALERLFQSRDGRPRFSSGEVEFTYAGCRVTVYSSGEVTASPDPDAANRQSARAAEPPGTEQ